MNEPNITEFIVETVLNHPFILGSQLGTKVKQRFPSFEKLKTYIDRYCVGQIICVRRHGPDFVYAHISQIERKAQPDNPVGEAVTLSQPESFSRVSYPSNTVVGEKVGFTQLPTRPARSVSVWSAFTNPGIDDRLAINTTTMEFQVVPRDRMIQPPIVEIHKVSPGEHHKIANDFLPQIEFQDRQVFQQAPGVAIVWSSWSWHIKQFADGKYFGLWLDFRTANLRKLLAERLAKMGFAETISEPLLNKLLESKQQRTSRTETIADFGGPPAARNQNSLTESELRRIATIAISEMSGDELRRLCFPLGAIVNALPSKNP
jgi:hypothetical protein